MLHTLNREWKVYLIQHSHTDIGFTERQEKLMRYHCDFILQATELLNKIHSGVITGAEGFKWQCENQWQVENFYKYATEESKRDFEKYVKSGEIGLSGNYLNMTELIDYDVLNSRIQKAKKFSDNIGYAIKSAMSADVNGYAWGYADALAENGIENLFCASHSHHGIFPLYKKQQPFFWETPKHNKVLVWSGEHYQLGNEMFLSPHAGQTYMCVDEIKEKIDNRTFLSTSAEKTKAEETELCQIRLSRYLNELEQEGYPFNFVPVLVSGTYTDNAPPNVHIAERVNEMNKIFAGRIVVEMATLDDFFAEVKKNTDKIPSYSGDFPDWWADGVGSTANAVKVFKDAQRKYDLCCKLDRDGTRGDSKLKEDAAENIMLYAEHTWGYSSSVSEPWDFMVGNLEKKKDAYATNANTYISENLDQILASYGEVSIREGRRQLFKIINPHDIDYCGTVKLYIEFWEYLDGIRFDNSVRVKCTDINTKEILPCQQTTIARAFEIEVAVNLKPHEEKIVEITKDETVPAKTVRNHAYMGSEGVRDILTSENTAMPFFIDTPYYSVKFTKDKGITSVFDKTNNAELINSEAEHLPFSGVYEYTPAKDGMCRTRRLMGRNRCSMNTDRYSGTLSDVRIVEDGDVFTTAKLDYKLEGTCFYSVFLKVYKTCAMLEAKVCMHKKSVWEPENLYISLPFTAGTGEETYIDKTGCIIRPGIDQLPGSCQSFYLLLNGYVKKGKDFDLILASKDAPLIVFGPREAAPVKLCSCDNIALNNASPYSWVMNNFWETNFKADLGGFYEFTYTLTTRNKEAVSEEMEVCKAINEGVCGFYI